MTLQDIMNATNAELATLSGQRFNTATEFHTLVHAVIQRHMPKPLQCTCWSIRTTDLHRSDFDLFIYDRENVTENKACKWEWKGQIKSVSIRIMDHQHRAELRTADYVNPGMTVEEARAAMDRAHAIEATLECARAITDHQNAIDNLRLRIDELAHRL